MELRRPTHGECIGKWARLRVSHRQCCHYRRLSGENYFGYNCQLRGQHHLGAVRWSLRRGALIPATGRAPTQGTPAVTVATSAPVLIQNSYISGPADLISDAVYGNNLTVKNVIGIGVNPNVAGRTSGIFVNAQHPALLDVENCYFENVVYGIWVRGYAGNRNGTQTITILNNRGRNTIGAESDGNGGYLPGETHWQWAHTIQIGNVNAVPGIHIAWNEFINYPYQSLVNEAVSMYDSGGTSSSPALFHDNYVQGAYAWNPAVDGSNAGGFATDGASSDTVQTASAFNSVYNNQIIDTVNMGIEFSTGHDNVAYDNEVISSGLLPNGAHIAAQNVGIAVYDVYGNIARGTMYNNNMYSNKAGWMCWAARCAWDGYRNDDYFPTNNSYYSTNTTIPTNPITLAMVSNEYTTWLSKISSNGKVVGPANASTTTNQSGGESTTLSPAAWYTVTNTNSSLCVEAAAGGVSNGTGILQYTCGANQADQEWQFRPTDSGYYQVITRGTASDVGWDVTGGPWATADGVHVQLWAYVGGTNQQWMPMSLGNGAYKFVTRNSSKCMDVPGASSAVLTPLQQYDCNGTGAQSFTLQQK